MPYLGTGAFSERIITPEMLTPDPVGIEEEAAAHRATAANLQEWADTRASANVLREAAIQSPGSEAMHAVHQQVVADIRALADSYSATATMCEQEAQIVRDVDRDQGNIDREAHEKIAAATTPAEIEEIIDTHHASAEAMSVRAAKVIYGQHAQWDKTHGAQLGDLTTRLSKGIRPLSFAPPPLAPGSGPLPANPAPPPPTDPLVPAERGKEQVAEPGSGTPAGQGGSPGSEKAGNGPGRRVPDRGGDGGGQDGAGNGQGPGQGVGGSGGLPFSPLSGGGFPGSGGGGSGLGAGGLSSGGPLSSLMGGLGSNPAASGLGSGLPTTNPVSNAAGSSALGNPAGLFAQGLSSGASSVSPVSSAAPATAAPSSVGNSAGGLAGAPGAGAGGGPAAPAAAGGSGLHATPAAAGAGPSASASAVPAMLPSTGMGAAPAGGGAGPAVSAVGSSTSAASGSAGSGGPAAGSAGGAPVGNAGPTLVPAAVVSPADTGQRGKVLSRDARAAATLAWLLQHQCHRVFPLDWAVGVFRSNAGSETVVVSAEGSSYVPAGVFVPRGVQLLVADPLVDKAFRDRWFGCSDPAQVLVDYARLRRESGWELAAAATNGPVDQLRGAGVEYADSCTFDRSPLRGSTSVAVLDAMHVHRLQLEFPDLYERLVRLSGAEDRFGRELMMAVARGLVDEVSGFQHPLELPQTWSALVAGEQPSTQAWQHYATVTSNEFMFTTPKRPPACPVEVYRQAWMVCRALEVVGGFAGRPLPLADMVYALAAAWPGLDVRWQVEPLLRAAEVELGW